MLWKLLEWFVEVLSTLSYGALVIAILAGSFGVPIPEEIVLLIAGYLAGIEFFDIKYVMLVCFVSMVVGDNIGYILGYRGSKLVEWILKTTKTKWLRDHLERHPCKTIFLSRFLSGFRVFFPIAAGSIKMPWKKFFLTDVCAVIVLVPVFVLLGFYLKPHFDALMTWILKVDRFMLGVIIGVIVISVVGTKVIKYLCRMKKR